MESTNALGYTYLENVAGVSKMGEPKYARIIKIINARIADQTYKPGELLPKQEELASELSVSRMTVKRAMDILAEDGVVIPQRGIGTIVRKQPGRPAGQLPVNAYEGLSKDLGVPVTSKVLYFDIHFPDPKVQEALELEANDPVYEIKRLRIVNGQPYGLEHTFLTMKIIPNLDKDALLGSFYTFLKEERGLKVGSQYRMISAEKAGDDDVEYLGSEPNEPVLQVEQTTYLEDGRPFDMSIDHHPYGVHHKYTYLSGKSI